MDEILYMDIKELAGASFECSCGKTHSVDIKKIIIGKNLDNEIVDVISDFSKGKILMVSDKNTYRVYGNKLASIFKENGFSFNSFTYKNKKTLIPDETAVGRLLIEMDKDVKIIAAVGSGTINDICRMISFKTGIPYIIFGTAPSMDGYASVVSPLIVEGFKKTFEAVYPYAIIADIDVMKKAPTSMICAGFGDIIGKYTALTDWKLSKKINGEYSCDTSIKIVKNALKKCVDNVNGIKMKDENAIKLLMEALVLSGVTIGLVGNSRPASGAEHHMAHYWEMDAIAKHQEHPLHGNEVGVASVVIATIYSMMKEKGLIDIEYPDPNYLRDLLKKVGACETPKTLGIDRELFKRSIVHAKEVRPRYTIFHLAEKYNLLDEFSEILTNKFYGEE